MLCCLIIAFELEQERKVFGGCILYLVKCPVTILLDSEKTF